MTPDWPDWYPQCAEAAGQLRQARRLLILAGAGMSADAGVPTFRGSRDALYQQQFEGFDPHELASREGFAEHGEIVWDWYRDRRLRVAQAEPHEGQRALALLQEHLPADAGCLVATTNEDDLLERAGVDYVLHVHGSLFETRCTTCDWSTRDAADNAASFLPCPECGEAVRPGSIWFGEQVSGRVMDRIMSFRPEACLVIGSSSLVQPLASIPPEMLQEEKLVVEINPAETPLSSAAQISIRAGARAVLPVLVDFMTSKSARDQIREQQ